MEFVKDGFICKAIPEYTSDKIECICSEFTISKNKWICFSIYKPPVSSNLTLFPMGSNTTYFPWGGQKSPPPMLFLN